ncbi:MAG: efflux RND transporter periplasmic adaptor subunit [Planctomycetota bacterium]|nr:efflux RND transporter periplasmic adaptor subunit [Planctomycetota bacterium]
METYRPIVRKLGRCLIVGASLLPFATGCDSKVVPRAEVIRPVKTMILAAGEDTRTRLFPGRVEASRRVELAFQVSGILAELPVKEGQKIEKGELIARLRQDEFQARLASLEAQLTQARAGLSALQQGERAEEQLRRGMQARSAEARLANAKAELDRSAQLVRSNAVSRSEFELKQTNYRVAQEDHQAALQLVEKGSIGREEDIQAKEAVVVGLEARVVEANLNLSDSTLVAPYTGVIAQRFVEQGQNIRATEPVVRFQDIEEIEIAVDVPESVMVQDIRTADIVRLEVEVSGAPGLAFPVQIREIAQVADPTTQTFNVRVALEAPAEVRMLPGMTATVTAEYRRAKILGQRIMVPVSAVAKDSTGEQATWILEANGTVRRRAVKIGSIVGGDVEILEGLEPGLRIVTAGVTFLRDGLKVRDLGGALSGGSEGGN